MYVFAETKWTKLLLAIIIKENVFHKIFMHSVAAGTPDPFLSVTVAFITEAHSQSSSSEPWSTATSSGNCEPEAMEKMADADEADIVEEAVIMADVEQEDTGEGLAV